MNFIRNNVNKAVGLHYIMRYSNITPDNVLVAGNSINDVEILNEYADKRILVGRGEEVATVFSYLLDQAKIIRVEDPDRLGKYLQTIK